MAKIPRWLIGPGITTVTATPLTIANDGTISTTTPVVTFSLRWKNIKLESTAKLEEISASDVARDNNVPVSVSTKVTVDEIMQTGAPDSNPINAAFTMAFGAGSYWLFNFTRAGKTCTYYGTLSTYTEEASGKGAVMSNVVLDMVDPGSANPAFA
jgi:hypothetical protein